MITPDGTKNTSRRWDLWSEMGHLIGDEISYWRWHLQLEVTSPIGGDTSDWRWDLQLEVTPPIRGGTSNWRWDLQLEAPMLHVGISYSFEKKRDFLLLITSSCHLSTRWYVNLFSSCFCPLRGNQGSWVDPGWAWHGISQVIGVQLIIMVRWPLR